MLNFPAKHLVFLFINILFYFCFGWEELLLIMMMTMTCNNCRLRTQLSMGLPGRTSSMFRGHAATSSIRYPSQADDEDKWKYV